MEGVTSPDGVFEKMQRDGFQVGPHKALQFAREQKRIKIIVVSSIPPEQLERLLLIPAANIDDALTKAISIPARTSKNCSNAKSNQYHPIHKQECKRLIQTFITRNMMAIHLFLKDHRPVFCFSTDLPPQLWRSEGWLSLSILRLDSQ